MFFLKAMALLVISILLLGLVEGTESSGFSIEQIIFECTSAFATVGLSMGITPYLSVWGKVVISLTMFAGRVGLFSIIIRRMNGACQQACWISRGGCADRMKQFAVIGASTLGKRVLDELIEVGCEIILVDKDPEVIEQYKNDVTVAYVANVISKDTVKRLIPSDIDAAVVDMGSRIEASILVTQYLKQLGVGRIIVKAETKEHGEILDMVGAEHVVFPNLEAARRITPLLISDLLFQYLPISSSLVCGRGRCAGGLGRTGCCSACGCGGNDYGLETYGWGGFGV